MMYKTHEETESSSSEEMYQRGAGPLPLFSNYISKTPNTYFLLFFELNFKQNFRHNMDANYFQHCLVIETLREKHG